MSPIWENMSDEELLCKTKTVKKCFDLVKTFFNGDDEKANAWFRTPNPLLGGVSPDAMVFMGREQKLFQMISNQIEGNHE